jgi:hypothetical protein
MTIETIQELALEFLKSDELYEFNRRFPAAAVAAIIKSGTDNIDDMNTGNVLKFFQDLWMALPDDSSLHNEQNAVTFYKICNFAEHEVFPD